MRNDHKYQLQVYWELSSPPVMCINEDYSRRYLSFLPRVINFVTGDNLQNWLDIL